MNLSPKRLKISPPNFWVGIRTISDYSPFGVLLPERAVENEFYRRSFNGMEVDPEVKGNGNSYEFGARMLDPRLARWINPDMLEKNYANLSTYSFSNNSPIFNKDFDGNDWGQTTKIENDGSKTITLKLTAAVLNSSNQTFDMNAFKGAVETQVKNTYTVSWKEKAGEKTIYVKENGKTIAKSVPIYRKVNVVVETEFRVVNDESQLKSNEHLLEIVNPSEAKGIYARASGIGGTGVIINADKVSNIINGNDNNTMPHELGHTFGLRHIDQPNENPADQQNINNGGQGNWQAISPASQAKTPNNIMFSGGSPYMNDKKSTKIEPWQMRTGLKKLHDGKLNQ